VLSGGGEREKKGAKARAAYPLAEPRKKGARDRGPNRTRRERGGLLLTVSPRSATGRDRKRRKKREENESRLQAEVLQGTPPLFVRIVRRQKSRRGERGRVFRYTAKKEEARPSAVSRRKKKKAND